MYLLKDAWAWPGSPGALPRLGDSRRSPGTWAVFKNIANPPSSIICIELNRRQDNNRSREMNAAFLGTSPPSIGPGCGSLSPVHWGRNGMNIRGRLFALARVVAKPTARQPGNFLAVACLCSLSVLFAGCAAMVEHVALHGWAQGKPGAIVEIKPGSGCELVRLQTRDGTRIVAEFATALDDQGQRIANPERQRTLIFFYGSAGCLQNISSGIEYFRRMGMNVLVPEYPGFGMSEGHPSEKGLLATAEAAYDWLTNRPGLEHDQIIASGFSLGTCPAIWLASRRPVAGVLLLGAFTNAKELGQAHVARAVRWAAGAFPVRSPLNNLARIRAVSCPVLIVHGTGDTTTPVEMADRLAAAAVAAKVTRLSIAGAEHDFTLGVGDTRLWQAIDSWAKGNPFGFFTLEADTFLLTLARKGQLPGQAKGNGEIDGTLEGDESTAYPVSRTFRFQPAWVDVTPRIKSLAAGGPVSISVNNDLAGRDPAPYILKKLRVEFRRNGRQQTAEAAERQRLVLPAGAEVIRALYGRQGQPVDAAICHYTVVRESDGSPWKLQRAWRTDANGSVLEEYRIP